MVDKINPSLLTDTLNLVQLARETARVRGNQGKAEKLSPVVESLQTLVNNDSGSKAPVSPGIMGQSDFQTLIAASQKKSTNTSGTKTVEERNQMVTAMASGGMNDLEIARQLDMTREEVKMVLNIANIGLNSRRSI
jgi:hypothetical protein